MRDRGGGGVGSLGFGDQSSRVRADAEPRGSGRGGGEGSERIGLPPRAAGAAARRTCAAAPRGVVASRRGKKFELIWVGQRRHARRKERRWSWIAGTTRLTRLGNRSFISRQARMARFLAVGCSPKRVWVLLGHFMGASERWAMRGSSSTGPRQRAGLTCATGL